MFASKEPHCMKRIALFGQIAHAIKYLNIIDASDQFLLSGIKPVDDNFKYPEKNHDPRLFIFEDEEDLLACSDAIVFLSFHNSQYFSLIKALKASKHVFINPSSYLPGEILLEIQKLGEEAGILYYLRHKSLNLDLMRQLQNFNLENAEFIDIYRYVPAGNEKNEAIIHRIISRELMFIHSLVQHEIKKTRIKTVPYCSTAPYIINIGLEFSNSLTVNLTINLFTQNNARFAELYCGNKMLRINSDENKIEFAKRDPATFEIKRNNFKLTDEGRLSDEIKLFIDLLSEEKYPVEFKFSGMAVHHTIFHIINEIFEHYKKEVR